MPKSVRRVRYEERGEGEGRRPARPAGVPAWLVFLLVFVAAGLVGGGLVVAAVAYRYARSSAAAAPRDLAYKGDVAGLRKAYRDNELRADSTYKGKLVRLTGRLSRISKDSWSGQPILELDDNGSFLGSAKCDFDQHDPAQIQRLTNGDTVTIEGQCDGLRYSDLHLVHCRLQQP